jgi:hypothetical protein
MSSISSLSPAPRTKTTWRGIALAVLLGLVLGSAISALVVWLRPIPTGIAHVELIELDPDHRAGGSWVLELEVERAGYPFLIHVDDGGMPSLLFPDGEAPSLVAGERRRLPDATGRRAWRSPGGEVFVTLSGTPFLRLDQVIVRAEKAAADAGSDAAALRAVRKVLRKQLGPGVFVELPEVH